MDKSPFPIIQLREVEESVPCCGGPASPPADPHERPGYRICRFVEFFMETEAGVVPVVPAALNFADLLGTIRARVGVARNSYRIAPGLYAIGKPDKDSPVLATANYKLTFDSLRKELAGIPAWILVLDTRGINVWCAAAHKTFGTDELVGRVRKSGLEKIVAHRRIIVPQLGAPGVAGHLVKKACGFEVVWGPIRADDIPAFLQNGCKAEPEMRQLDFFIADRLVLSPVELTLAIKPTLISLAAIFVLSGVGPDLFSLDSAIARGLNLAVPFLAGLFSGAIVLPAALPWLPFRSFYLKGLLAAVPAGFLVGRFLGGGTGLELTSQIAICLAVSSYVGMNFTGATPYASPSGVEKEMRRAIPLQLVMLLVVLVCWIAAPFIRG